MSDARRTHDTDAGTDPRYHAAFQRGYDGPAPERGAKAEERFRRPRRRDAAATQLRTTALPTSEPVLDPIRTLGFERQAERTATAPEPLPSLPQDDIDERPTEPEGRPKEFPEMVGREWSALDVRVPLALAVSGVLLLVITLVFVWSSSSVVYGSSGSPSDQIAMYFLNFLPMPSITVGLLSIGAAAALRVARR
ncbi:hypothetical protein MT349_13265 [Rathayibacter caricis]|uniref:hypothetical protein n=1 Tax=Rathayibacter caricis TaxID=110936 RepID=UPI001FB50B04|nr:hypothetical protein [Rathayibacter caricis]MCJ1696747.1 hypothetical protein [Rathayibacter caricis]